MMMKFLYKSALLLSLIFFGACSTRVAESKIVNVQEMQAPLEKTHWKLNQFGLLTVVVESNIYIVLDKGRVSGSGGCNRLMSSYKTEGNKLSFTPIASTLMACPNMREEQQFFQAMREVTDYRIEGNRLTLFHDDAILLVFQAE